MANNPGQGGAFFKTKLSILNVTDFNYSVVITFFSKTGKSPQQSFQLKAREMRTWDNFLEAFGYQGAGAVEFDSWFDPPGGSDDFEFILSSETYTDSPNGRYRTLVGQAKISAQLSPHIVLGFQSVQNNARISDVIILLQRRPSLPSCIRRPGER